MAFKNVQYCLRFEEVLFKECVILDKVIDKWQNIVIF
jgi:hypothetical protein